MIGQKTLYSFFSPSPAGKRRARSPELADPDPGVAVEAAEAAAAEENRDAAVGAVGKRLAGAQRKGRGRRARR